MKHMIRTVLFGSMLIGLNGCGGGANDTTNGTGAVNTGTGEVFIGYSSAAGSLEKEKLYKTDGSVSGTAEFSSGVLAAVPANYSTELINTIEEKGNYLFVTSNKTRTSGCGLFGCPTTQFLYLVDKNSGAVNATLYTAGVSPFAFAPTGPIYQYDSSVQDKRYIFSHITSDALSGYQIHAVDTQTGASSPITLNGTDKIFHNFSGKSIDDAGNKVFFLAVDDVSSPTAYNIYSLDTDNGAVTDYPDLAGYVPVNLFAVNGKLVMFENGSLSLSDMSSSPIVPDVISTNINYVFDFGIEIDNKIYFAGENTANNTYHLYTLDPTQPAGSALHKMENINRAVDGRIENIFKYNGNIYYVQGDKLLKTDNDPTTIPVPVVSNLSNTNPGDNKIYQANGKLYFRGTNTAAGDELWSYDGTNSTLEVDINQGGADSFVKNIVALDNNTVVFEATTNGTTNQLFKWDGTMLSPLN